ncbi:hypothetical protein C8R45DRAFT_935029 [Mycena sanguinolenta]|nr:hypothetical protein C8R45DRAFT_935029 [Mycena sanguinolenta]
MTQLQRRPNYEPRYLARGSGGPGGCGLLGFGGAGGPGEGPKLEVHKMVVQTLNQNLVPRRSILQASLRIVPQLATIVDLMSRHVDRTSFHSTPLTSDFLSDCIRIASFVYSFRIAEFAYTQIILPRLLSLTGAKAQLFASQYVPTLSLNGVHFETKYFALIGADVLARAMLHKANKELVELRGRVTELQKYPHSTPHFLHKSPSSQSSVPHISLRHSTSFIASETTPRFPSCIHLGPLAQPPLAPGIRLETGSGTPRWKGNLAELEVLQIEVRDGAAPGKVEVKLEMSSSFQVYNYLGKKQSFFSRSKHKAYHPSTPVHAITLALCAPTLLSEIAPCPQPINCGPDPHPLLPASSSVSSPPSLHLLAVLWLPLPKEPPKTGHDRSTSRKGTEDSEGNRRAKETKQKPQGQISRGKKTE